MARTKGYHPLMEDVGHILKFEVVPVHSGRGLHSSTFQLNLSHSATLNTP